MEAPFSDNPAKVVPEVQFTLHILLIWFERGRRDQKILTSFYCNGTWQIWHVSAPSEWASNRKHSACINFSDPLHPQPTINGSSPVEHMTANRLANAHRVGPWRRSVASQCGATSAMRAWHHATTPRTGVLTERSSVCEASKYCHITQVLLNAKRYFRVCAVRAILVLLSFRAGYFICTCTTQLLTTVYPSFGLLEI